MRVLPVPRLLRVPRLLHVLPVPQLFKLHVTVLPVPRLLRLLPPCDSGGLHGGAPVRRRRAPIDGHPGAFYRCNGPQL